MRLLTHNGRNSLGVSLAVRGSRTKRTIVLHKFATELVGTENYGATDAFSLKPFFDNLGAPLATHRDIRYAKTILLIGGEPEELQPLTGKQIRQAVRNGAANLIVVNSRRIRLRRTGSAVCAHSAPAAKTQSFWRSRTAQRKALQLQRWASTPVSLKLCVRRSPTRRATW